MSLVFRTARADDLPRLIALLADDSFGVGRESTDEHHRAKYRRAFELIDADPNNELVVAMIDDELIGVMQITYIPSLTYQGGQRAMIEGVRIAKSARGCGYGRTLIREAIARARERGCRIVQLTTDKRRTDALRFYEALGFVSSHEGMKLHLSGGSSGWT